jgi:hypothetical protein
LNPAVMNCGFPGYLDNGEVTGHSYLFGDTVSFSCSPGFRLFGPTSQLCLPNGTWSGLKPVCEGEDYLVTSHECVQLGEDWLWTDKSCWRWGLTLSNLKGAQAWEFFARVFCSKRTHLGMWLRVWVKKLIFLSNDPCLEGLWFYAAYWVCSK